MKKMMVVVLAAAALVCGSSVFAALPVSVSESSDSGTELIGLFCGLLQPEMDCGSLPILGFGEEDNGTALAIGLNNVAAAGNGSQNVAAGAVAECDGIATNGIGNVTVDQDGNIAFGFAAAGECNTVACIDQNDADFAVVGGDNMHLNLDARYSEVYDLYDGSVGIIGDGNEVSVVNDYSYVDGYILENAYGVVARVAEISNSFNVRTVDVDIDACIVDSFNVETTTMEICGENELSAIVNANSTDDQAIGANLNLTNAAATAPETAGISAFNISGNAIALTLVSQLVVNNPLGLSCVTSAP